MSAELVAHDVTVQRAQPRGAAQLIALDQVSMSVNAGEIVAIMGSTGAGKSTLALALTGLVELNSGRISGPAAGAVRMVLQRPESTFLTERVLDEVMQADLARGTPIEVAEARARGLLEQLMLPAELAERDPLTLSGGEQRRVAIAAVLSAEPRVVMLDEPGAGLDPAARAQLHDAIRGLHAAGRTIVLVTHDPGEALALAMRLVVLRAGRIAWDGAPAPVLGDVARAAELGVAVTAEARITHALARARRTEHAAPAGEDRSTGDERAAGRRMPSPQAARVPLTPLVDARARIVACALVAAATLISTTVLGVGIILVACTLIVAMARIDAARVRLAVRPLIALAILLVLLQVLVGGAATTQLMPGRETDLGAVAALLRAMQASAIVLAALALSAGTAVTDLAAGMSRLLAPLRLVRIPVDVIAFTVATALGLVPTFADELERLRLAQRARGISARPGVVGWARHEASLLVPLFVAAFRRAHLLADALAVRGVDPRVRRASWRARELPTRDVLMLCGAMLLVAMSRVL